MSKITLNNVGSLIDATTAAATINANNAVIQTAFDNTFSRDGTFPNTLTDTLDVNSNQIVNLPQPATANSPLRLQDLDTFVGGGTVTNIPSGGNTGDRLVKSSNANYAVAWGSEAADLTAGTNIAITGTSPATISLVAAPTTLGTNITGTASGLTSGNVTTNANLTGPITSVGNTTSIASQTGTGSKFVVDTSPTLVTPNLGTPSAIVLTNATGTAASLTAGHVTTNANLTGAVTSVGNAASLGSFTSANLSTALTDETGSGAAVFATSPALVTPTGIVKGDVGLGNVDNTSDTTKWAATATLTNKTYDTAGAGNSFSINGVAATANTGTGAIARAAAPTFTTPVLGAATATTVNGNTLTTGTYTLTGTAAKTLTFNNSLTLAGTDSTTMTFPTTSATVARTDAANTFTGHQTIEGVTSTGATGTGKFVFDTSPTLVTPVLGAATATTINGAALDNLAWTTYTPTVTASSGTPTTVSATGRYKIIGKTIVVQASATVTSVGTAINAMKISLPFASNNLANYVGSCYESGVSGKSGAGVVQVGNQSTIFTTDATGTTWWANGKIVDCTITYELP